MRARILVGTLLLAVVAATAQVDVTQAAAGPPERGFITDTVLIPSSSSQANELGRDMDGDGDRDNRIGQVLATFSGQDIDTTGAMNEAIVNGDIVLLHAVRTFSFANSSNATWQVWYGDPTPNPDLTGAGTFELPPGQPHSTRLAATIKDHKVKTVPGTIPLRLDMGSGPFLMSLKKAVVFAECTRTACTNGRIAGAVTRQQVDNVLLPVLADLIEAIIARDCPGPGPESCADGSTGGTLVGIFDTNDDLLISDDEVRDNDIIRSAFAPDLNLTDATWEGGAKESVSLGIGFTTVKATLTRP